MKTDQCIFNALVSGSRLLNGEHIKFINLVRGSEDEAICGEHSQS